MKQLLDHSAFGLATGSFVGTMLSVVPPILAGIASLCAIIWYGIRFYEYRKSKKLD